MSQQHLRVLLGFSRQTDGQVMALAGAVIAGMSGNKAYPSPPVDLSVVQSVLTDFTAAVVARPQGGPPATADKEKKRLMLVKLLRKLAVYVQATCDDDLATLLSSGFQAPAGRRNITAPSTPVIASVDNGHSTQLLVKVINIANARSYQVRWASQAGGVTGPWQEPQFFTKARSMSITGLIPGTIYALQARAFGSSGTRSDWSDPVSHMCM